MAKVWLIIAGIVFSVSSCGETSEKVVAPTGSKKPLASSTPTVSFPEANEVPLADPSEFAVGEYRVAELRVIGNHLRHNSSAFAVQTMKTPGIISTTDKVEFQVDWQSASRDVSQFDLFLEVPQKIYVSGYSPVEYSGVMTYGISLPRSEDALPSIRLWLDETTQRWTDIIPFGERLDRGLYELEGRYDTFKLALQKKESNSLTIHYAGRDRDVKVLWEIDYQHFPHQINPYRYPRIPPRNEIVR